MAADRVEARVANFHARMISKTYSHDEEADGSDGEDDVPEPTERRVAIRSSVLCLVVAVLALATSSLALAASFNDAPIANVSAPARPVDRCGAEQQSKCTGSSASRVAA